MTIRNLFSVLLCCAVIGWAAHPAHADSCANAGTVRILVKTRSVPPAKTDVDPNGLAERRYAMESGLRDALVKKLAMACLITDPATLDDPKSYPALKGSVLMDITATPSPRNPKVAAIAVEFRAVEGPYAQNIFPIGFLAVLVEEGDSDFFHKADEVLRYWTYMGGAIGGHR